ncbi:27 kDa hemolymph protein-like [Ctenocephalides felis]|uniref:27 kDa hemolymph protein-like n=1 Tax=Ctenocephalides felis TaxID=7515 RepID=UPI000E6E55DE|nr:27 kDa hemolymph protein-like [Ctenocephalides felis]
MKAILASALLVLSLVLNVSGKDNLPNSLDELSKSLPSDVANQINTADLPKQEEAKKLFKEKCRKNSGGDEAFEKASTATEDLKACILSQINVEIFKKEVEDAKPTGDLDLVFKKYCRKSPDIKQCVFNFTATLEPCLEPKERENKRVLETVASSLADFICFKEGDRIALFIAEGGPECLQSKQEMIKSCFNSTMGKYAPTETPTIENLPKLLLDAEQCQDIQNLQQCIVTELEKCEEPTPANIVDSLFRFVRKQTPCASKPLTARSVDDRIEDSHNDARKTVVHSLVMIIGLFLILQ